MASPTKTETTKIYGWYDKADQPVDQPTYNPPFDSPCPYCSAPLTDDDVRTHSLMYPGASKAFFYRTHRTCDEIALPSSRERIDRSILDSIEAANDK
jgi:hypothetical protein